MTNPDPTLPDLRSAWTADPPTPVHINREMRRTGFRRQRKEFRLLFQDTALAGLEVHVRSVPVGTMLELAELAGLADDFTAEGMRSLGVMFELLAAALVAWNLEDEDGTPVPADIEGIRTLDLQEAMLIIKHWMEAAAGVSGPLGQPSGAGKPSGAVPLPMEPLSASPGS